jgi:sulfate adenylyltransferase
MSAPGSVTGLPAWHPPHGVLELAELVLSGAISPASAPLVLPDEHAGAEALVLEDAEGTPVAVLRRGRPDQSPDVGFEPLKSFSHGPVRSGRRTPAQIRNLLAGAGTGGVLAVPVSSMVGAATVDAVVARAAAAGQSVLWLAVFGDGRPSVLPPAGLWRAVRDISEQATAAGVDSIAVPVAVPLRLGTDPVEDAALIEEIAGSFGGTEVLEPEPVDSQAAHPSFVRERERAVPPPYRRGLTIFFTGLSGSGKSTLAKALAEELAERSPRTVSLLDGDEVRRMLSAGLGFSRADRDLNIRRIGFVATEVSRHGGIAICAPIAPFARTRAQVRAAVEEVGDFVLIHVSTPLAECERRDRKGLYAKARQGLIPDFTGISSPYEVPVDADLRLDTSRQDVTEGLAAVWALLTDRGYLAVPDRDSRASTPEKV